MDNKDIQQQIDNLQKRVTALEAVTAQVKTNKLSTAHTGEAKKTRKSEYSGPKGGILLLEEEGFLKTRKTADEVWVALEKKGYIYKKDVVRTALNRLSKSTGPLVKIEERGGKFYVERK